MPRKKKDVTDTKKSKKTLLNTIVKNINKDEHIILQLPLTQNNIDKITNKSTNENYVPIPKPYEKDCYYIDDTHNDFSETLEDDNFVNIKKDINCCPKYNQCCFWCCHKISFEIYGMPINYNSLNDTFEIYGSFCSLQCANAYNFSAHTGSDKVWEINSLIQMLGKRYGIKNFIRPAPSRYLLTMFNGYLSIDEFRELHKNDDTCHILNLPPMISIQSGYETINTSYIKNNTEN